LKVKLLLGHATEEMQMEERDETENELEETEINEEALEPKPSWLFAPILVLYIIIAVITPYIGMTIGLILFFALVSFFIWNAVSLKSYEKTRASYPGYSRSEYILNNLIFQTVLPLIIFSVLVWFVSTIR